MKTRRAWKLPERDHDAEQTLAQEVGTSPLLAALLRNRGFGDVATARAFLEPRLSDLEDPGVISDMEAGAQRLKEAIHRKERVVVFGDYDVDGMTGTVVLVNFIRLAGGEVDFHIPNRLSEGYSFSAETVEALIASEQPPQVIVTVDHGISAHDAIARLAEAGVAVIVTDHHEPPATLPRGATALINPRRPGCPSRFKSLCGAAVAFKLVWATAQKMAGGPRVSPEFREYLLEAMALVAMATVTDVVPLVGENRILCHHGLAALAVSRNPGIRSLLDLSRLKGQVVRAVHIGFRLGPRLNAAGRLGMAEKAIALLTSRDPEEAHRLAKELDEANDRRRAIERDMLRDIDADPVIRSFAADRGLCLGRRDWHPGVIGIAAARLVDRFQVPVMLVALDGARGRGSARAPAGIHLREVLDECGEHLVSFGGHAGAAGCTVTEEAFPAFQEAFERITREAIRRRTELPALDVDLEISFRQIRAAFVEELERLAPHGAANPPARFVTRGLAVAGHPSIMGKDRSHLSFHVRQDDRTFRAVAFGRAGDAEWLRRPGARLDLCYRLKFDTYRNPGAIELEVEDLRPAERAGE